jgi:pimeloyl-ACP methyl ester carboxylesterase
MRVAALIAYGCALVLATAGAAQDAPPKSSTDRFSGTELFAGKTITILRTYQNNLEPNADDPPLHTAAALQHGVTITEPGCRRLATALWLRVDGRGFCVRHWMSTAGGMRDEATVFIHGDLVSGRIDESGRLNAFASRVTAGQVQRFAHSWSRVHAAPYLAIGRLGAFGSSGNHGDRMMLIEIKVVMAALDALKEQHNFKRFHLVGQSGGAHTVAALLQMRQDIGCAVMTSGAMSYKTAVLDRGLPVTARIWAGYDPIDHVESMQDRPGQRLFVLSDPQDRLVSFRSQREFVEQVRGQGVPIVQITASAGDEDHHGLQSEGLRLAADCAKGADDQTLIARYQTSTQPVARR